MTPMPTQPSTQTDFSRRGALASPRRRTAAERLVRAYFLIAAVCFAFMLSGAAAPGDRFDRMAGFETEHYVVHTDLPADLSRDMADELEFCYREFSRRLEMFDRGLNDGEKFNVYLFARESDYGAFTDGRFPNTGGIFMSGRRALAVYYEGQGRNQMRKTLRHEAFHQFAFNRIGYGLPVWVNEGLAQLFEESIRVNGGLRVGLVPPERLRQLQFDLRNGRLTDFGTLLRYSDADWARTLADRGRAATQYTQAWAMVHFLLYAVDADGNALYRDRFNNMLAEIARGRSGWGAFTGEFGENFDGFRARFEQYVADLRPTPEAVTLEDQRVLAEFLVLLKERNVSFASVDEFKRHVVARRYQLECRRDDVAWSTDPDVDVYFRDSRGRPLGQSALRFLPDPAGALPCLERRPGDGLLYRTRFYRVGDKVMHETLCALDPVMPN